MCRDSPVVVWIPHYKAYLVADAEELCYTGAAIQTIELWAREKDVRVYVAQDEITHNARIRGIFNQDN